MTLEEYNKSRPNEVIVYQDPTIVVRVKLEGDETKIYVHSKSKDGYEQLPRGYMLGSNMLIHKQRG